MEIFNQVNCPSEFSTKQNSQLTSELIKISLSLSFVIIARVNFQSNKIIYGEFDYEYLYFEDHRSLNYLERSITKK